MNFLLILWLEGAEQIMKNPVLKYKDGTDSQNPDHKNYIILLQNYFPELNKTGEFDKPTLETVKNFQKNHNLVDDGIVGERTWEKLNEKYLTDMKEGSYKIPGFRGDIVWIHRLEGHCGKVYWPGGNSGITFDPGVDIGYFDITLFKRMYSKYLTADQMAAAINGCGLKADKAKAYLESNSLLSSISISREASELILPIVATPYWNKICSRFPVLCSDSTPSSIQTVFLSLAYNRGPDNKDLSILKLPLEESDWNLVADLISSMQQDHKIPEIRKRRRMEADLIRNELVSV